MASWLAVYGGFLEAAVIVESETESAAASEGTSTGTDTGTGTGIAAPGALFQLYVLADGEDRTTGTEYAADLGRFATALRNNHQIESLHLNEAGLSFLLDESSNEADADTDDDYDYYTSDHLMGEVLGSHPSLTHIILENGILARKNYINAFVSAALRRKMTTPPPRTPLAHPSTSTSPSPLPFQHLRELELCGTRHHSKNFCCGEGIAGIAKLLRENIPIEKLVLQKWRVVAVSDHGDDDNVVESGCNGIFQALDGNTHLRELILRDCCYSYSEQRLTLAAVQALGRSNLRELTIPATLLGTIAGSESPSQEQEIMNSVLAEGLRTNSVLESLRCCSLENRRGGDDNNNNDEDGNINQFQLDSQRQQQEWALAARYVDLLTTFNFTLRQLKLPTNWSHIGPIQAKIDQLLQFNRGVVRTTHTHLQRLSYHMVVNHSSSATILWPITLEKISSKPSLVFRFIRHGNLIAFSKVVVVVESSSSSTSNSAITACISKKDNNNSHNNNNNNNNNKNNHNVGCDSVTIEHHPPPPTPPLKVRRTEGNQNTN